MHKKNKFTQDHIISDVDLSNHLLNEHKTAKILDLSQKTLQGCGPHYIKLSVGAVRYRYGDLMEWIDDRRFRSTTEADQYLEKSHTLFSRRHFD